MLEQQSAPTTPQSAPSRFEERERSRRSDDHDDYPRSASSRPRGDFGAFNRSSRLEDDRHNDRDRGFSGGYGGDRYTRDEATEEELFSSNNNSGINFDKYENIPVDTKGRNVPEPIDDFKSVKLPSALQRNIELARFAKPTPVQRYSIPIVAEKRDLMACAQTGSGKTGGFLFPVISRLLSENIRPDENSSNADNYGGYSGRRKAAPTVLVLAPTRELTTQIYDEARKFTYKTGLHSVVVYGGTDIRHQITQCQRGCDLLVATPGRLVDLIDRGHVTLTSVHFLVLDEADRMLDMGFEPQIRYIVEKAGMPEAGVRNTLMFSATFPRNIQKLAADFLNDYIFLTVGRVGSTTENITQQFESCTDYNKKDLLLQHVNRSKDGLTLIFVQTKKEADYLENFLVQNGFRTSSIHGDRTQREREYALKNFKKGVTPILVATDVASRGLDIDNVNHVINYDMPENIDDYVHRIGRTGRAGNTGVSTAFFTDKNKNLAAELIKLLEETNQSVPDFMKRAREDSRYGSSNNYRRGGGGGYGGGRGNSHPFGGGSGGFGYGSSRGGFGSSRGYGGN
jgi:ATP-dependent RNA helicase DDX3X